MIGFFALGIKMTDNVEFEGIDSSKTGTMASLSLTERVLIEMLAELKIIKIHLSVLSGEEIDEGEIE